MSFDGISFEPISMLPSAGTIDNETVFATSTASITTIAGLVYDSTLTITGISSLVSDHGIAGKSFTGRLGTFASRLGNIELGFYVRNYFDTINLSATNSVSEATALTAVNNLTIISTATCVGITLSHYDFSLNFSATSAIVVGSGQSYNNNLAIQNTSIITPIYSTISFQTLTIAATASVPAPTNFVGKIISVDATSSITTSVIGSYNLSLTVAGVSSEVITSNANFVLPPVVLSNSSAFFDEHLYNVLLGVVVQSSISISELGIKNQPEASAAVSGVSFGSTAVYVRTTTQTLTLHQTALSLTPHINRTVSQTLGILQSLSKTRLHFENITQHITFTETQYPIHPIHQTINFVQAIISKKVNTRTITQTLSVNQIIHRPGTFFRGIAQTLKFNPPRDNLLPIFNGQQVANPYPNIYAGLVTRACKIILSVPQRTIVLPCPQLNDTQAILSSLNLKRTMTGDTYTYIKRAKQNKLVYKLWLTRQKSLEFRDFILAYYAMPLTIVNWKGETWIGTIQNSPIDLTAEERWQPVGERVDISLEFDAIKIGG